MNRSLYMRMLRLLMTVQDYRYFLLHAPDYHANEVAAITDAANNSDVTPTIVCLCGSTRFGETFQEANLRETLGGKIVLSIGCNMKSDTQLFGHLPDAECARIKTALDALHFRKIELADEVLILNVDDYIGDSTRRELAHARSLGKVVRWWNPGSAHALEGEAG